MGTVGVFLGGWLAPAPVGSAHMVTGTGVALIGQHHQPRGGQFPQDAPDPAGGQVVDRARERAGDPQDLAVGAEMTWRFMPWWRCLPE